MREWVLKLKYKLNFSHLFISFILDIYYTRINCSSDQNKEKFYKYYSFYQVYLSVNCNQMEYITIIIIQVKYHVLPV